MTPEDSFWRAIKDIQATDGRFRLEAYPFLMQALDFTMQRVGERRHVSAAELLDGVCHYARHRFGPLAHEVIDNWGVRIPGDIGDMVYQLIGMGVLAQQPSDDRSDFDIEFALKDRLEENYWE